MAIILRTGAEPLTSATRISKVPSILADSDATRILAQQLRRYCRGKISGRSFLIAGQRGSGKTTLVTSSIEKLMRESLREQYLFQPLFVYLHGPSLLVEDKDRPKFTECVKEGDKTVTKRIPLEPIAVVLTQITLGLYQAVAREMTALYRKRILEAAKDESMGNLKVRELLEMASQLELESDSYVEPARLRNYWEWGGFLNRGLMFPKGHRRPPDQGYREILAFGSLGEAYRRISGDFLQVETSSAGAEARESATISADTTKIDLMSPLIALASGGAVGTAVLGFYGGSLPAALAGLITALGAALALNYSASRSRERKDSRQTTFLPDLSVATLDRVLPVIVKRVSDAGFAPVFVVDELDKVEKLSKRLLPIVGNLKKLVAESAIFCFLTDREYFEEIQSLVSGNKDNVIHTYYTHQLFTTFKPDDLHAYLEQVLALPGAEISPSNPEPHPITQDEDASKKRSGSEHKYHERVIEEAGTRLLSDLRIRKLRKQYPEEAADIDVLQYVLLHQACMHPVDLHRRLAALRGEGNALSLPLGSVRTTKANQIDLLIQLAIEMVLDRPDVHAAIEREPNLQRLVYDALYYPSRSWRQGESELNLDGEKGKATLHAYLRDRTGIEGVPKSAKWETAKAKIHSLLSDREGFGADIAREVEFGERTQALLKRNEVFLIQLVQSLAELLSDNAAFEAELKAWRQRTGKRLSRAVQDTLPDPSSGALLRKLSNPKHFRWRYSYSGVPVEGEEPAVPSDPEAAYAKKRQFLQEFSEFIESLGRNPATKVTKKIDLSSLSTAFGIIDSRPAWPNVQAIVGDDQPSEEDKSVVNEYCSLLRRQGETLAVALYCAAVIGKASGKPADEGLLFGLGALSQGYRLLEFETDILDEELVTLMDETHKRFSDLPDIDLPPLLEPNPTSGKNWQDWVAAGMAAVEKFVPKPEDADLQRATERAWVDWRRKMMPPRDAEVSPSPTLDQLICDAAQRPPATLLKFDAGAMTHRDWSKLLYASSADIPADSADYAPLWAMTPAMTRLGLIPGRLRGITDAKDLKEALSYKKRIPSDKDFDGLKSANSLVKRRKPISTALIIRSSKSSLTASWPTAATHPAIILNTSEAKISLKTIKRFRRIGLFDFNFNRLIVEEPSDNRAIKTIAQGLNWTAPDLLFYSSEPHPEPKGIPYLVAPIESVQELLERKPLKTSLTRRSLWQLFIDLLKGHQSKDNPDDVDKNSQKHY